MEAVFAGLIGVCPIADLYWENILRVVSVGEIGVRV